MSEFINKRPVENCFFLKYLQRNLFKKDKKYYFFVCPMPIYINKERDIFYCEVLAFICPLYIYYIYYICKPLTVLCMFCFIHIVCCRVGVCVFRYPAMKSGEVFEAKSDE